LFGAYPHVPVGPKGEGEEFLEEGWVAGTESRIGREEGLKIRTSQPRRWRMREASKAMSLE